MNVIWKTAQDSARKLNEQESGAQMKSAEAALLAAQRGWIAYRDGHSELAGWEAHGGSMEPMLVWGCGAEADARANQAVEEILEGVGH